MEVHSAEPLAPEPSTFEVQVATVNLKIPKSPGTDKISAELIEANGRRGDSYMHEHINSNWNKRKCLRSGGIQSL